MGASGYGTEGGILPLAYNDALGTKFKVLTEFRGGGEINLAIERREADGRVVSFMTVADWYKAKKIRIILQHGIHKHPDLPDIPLAQDVASNEEDRKLLAFFGILPGIGYPFFAPPGVTKERIEDLRGAFQATMRDPAYIAEAKISQYEINPVSGAEIDSLISELYASPAPVLERARQIFNRANGPK